MFGFEGPRSLSELSKWRFGVIYSNSACPLFRQIAWEILHGTTYNFYVFFLKGLGFGV